MAAAIVIAYVSMLALGQEPAQSDTAADTAFSKSVDGFSAMLAVTANPEWAEQLRRADGPNGLPVINATRSTAIGSKVWLLVLFANPLLDQKAAVHTSLHVVVTRPDGKVGFDQANLVCFNGPISGAAQLVRLCETTLQVGFDPGDPQGIWRVSATVRDDNRRTVVAVESTVEVHGE